MKTFYTAAALAALSTPAALSAQEADDRAIVVTASRSGDAERVEEVPASITALDAQALEQRQTRFVSDILRDVPGIAVSSIPGLGQIRIRGGEANHTLVLIDGIEASDPFAGEFDFGSLLADPSARVEVLRGQQSALYGSDAIGGVVHYITASGAEDPGISLRGEAGSFETFTGAARIGGLSGGFDYAASVTGFTSEGTPNARGGTRNIGRDNVSASAKLGFAAAPNLRLEAVARYVHGRADINNQDFDFTSPTYGYVIDSPGSYVRNSALYGLVRAELGLLDGRWTQALSAQIADVRREGYDFDKFNYGNEGNRQKASYESVFRFGAGEARHKLTAAADAEREEYRNLDPNGFAFTGKRRTDNLGLVAQYELEVGDALSLGASLRHDVNDRFRDATTYRLQAAYLFPSGTRIRAAAGTGIKNPGFYELFGYIDGRFIGNPGLKPERSEGWEAGVDQRFGEGAGTIGATYFDNRLEDEIFVTYPAPSFVPTPANRGESSSQKGVETFVQARLGPQWRLDASYTWLRARESGLEEVRRAPNIASLNLAWRAPAERGGATLTIRHNGEQRDLAFINPASFDPVRVTLDDYTLVNLAADWQLTGTLSLFARAENLLDEGYEEVFSFRSRGRSLYAGLKARF